MFVHTLKNSQRSILSRMEGNVGSLGNIAGIGTRWKQSSSAQRRRKQRKLNIFQVLKELDISPMEYLDFPLYELPDSMKIMLILTSRAVKEARRRQQSKKASNSRI
jgi:hypothetical protein